MVKSIIKKVNKNSKSDKKEDSVKVIKPIVGNKLHKVDKKIDTKEQKPAELKHDKHTVIKTAKVVKPKYEKTKSSKVETPKPVVEIYSLKQLEEKILEKIEENKTEIKEDWLKDTKNTEEITHAEMVDKIESEPVPESKIENTEMFKDIDAIKPESKNDKNTKTHKEKNHTDTDNSNNTDYKSRVEAILFAVGKYLDDEMIAQLCDIDKRHVKKALEELKIDYDARDGALMIVQEGSSWKINVREKYLSLVRKVVTDTELSKSIMETLAVIAWKTPIYQNEIVKIRGNKCYDHIEELVNSGFVTKDKKGRSYILKTTEKFYNYFDIDSKNLHGVMSEAKIPTEQKTLDEINKPEEIPYSREKLLHALETIETKSIVQTEEDKLSQKRFLEDIHKKIDEASKRTDEVVAEMPKPMYETLQTESAPEIVEINPAENAPAPLHGPAITENEDDIVINTDSENGEHHFQKPEEQLQKVKSLTRKQLEKKFKDELQRVKEKTEHKSEKSN